MARGDGTWLRCLSAVSPSGRHMGCKLISAYVKPDATRASYLVALFDQFSMNLNALIDGNRITGIRTAATAAVAVDVAAPRKPLRIGVIGSGFEANGLLSALMSVRAVEVVRVFSPTPSSRERFASTFQSGSLNVDAVASAREAVAGADVVLCAARSRDGGPVFKGEWLELGMTVVSIGSTLPEQREVDEETIARSALIVADMPHEVTDETGDLLAATAGGVPFADKIVSLSDFVAGRIKRKPEDIVLYKSVGSALQDIVTAEMLFDRARERSLGFELSQSIVPVKK
jgi:ornithine cyclodeaminase/alanine dehydrogenase